MIALGRAVLATLFLLSILLDHGQTSDTAAFTHGVLLVYAIYATLTAVLTWRNWWLDARIAAGAHLIDMAVFTVITFSTNGYTSPFFLFFAFPLLSSAIRWGWRETALTALALVLLYFLGSLLFSSREEFQLQRFVARSAHLIILSAMLIWFGIHQRSARLFFHLDEFDTLLPEDADARERALRLVMRETTASRGMLLLRSAADDPFTGPLIDGEGMSRAVLDQSLFRSELRRRSLLFDTRSNRTLAKSSRRHAVFGTASEDLNRAAVDQLALREGLICPVVTGTVEGWLVLERISDLSADYLDIGDELGHAVAAMLERYALFAAIEETAGTRGRLTLARDVHDSIVQFLAGAAFRVEAISRAGREGTNVESDLQELKQLLVDEQRDVRSFISAVRRERTLSLREVVADLSGLAVRLSRQWSVDCSVHAGGPDVPIQLRLQLDLQQIIREAVANAVRHGRATQVIATLTAAADHLRLDLLDNGRGFAMNGNGEPAPQPWSLKDRIERAKGSLMVMSEGRKTQVTAIFPIQGAGA